MHARNASIRAATTALTTLLVTLALAPLLAEAAAPRFMKLIEDAAETPRLDLLLTSGTTAIVRARRCDQCPLLELSVDADTLIVRPGGARVGLAEAEALRDGGATVLFEPETLRVTRILLRR